MKLKNLKKRIKRALAGFFREELLEIIKYENPRERFTNQTIPQYHNLEFGTITMEHRIGIYGNDYEDQLRYERELERCKRAMAEEVMKNIHIQTERLTDPEFAFQRALFLTLRVQEKQK